MWCQRTFPVLPLSTQPVFQPGRIICCPTDLLFSFPVLTEPVCMLTFPPGISFPRLHPKKCNDTSKRGSVALRPVKSSVLSQPQPLSLLPLCLLLCYWCTRLTPPIRLVTLYYVVFTHVSPPPPGGVSCMPSAFPGHYGMANDGLVWGKYVLTSCG